ncbi:hypothetical protein [Nostoc sp. MG11]|uniref:hypothetical protein n=1 Tax=Nostoc sp. MG11 TaxID=2721166 RepID=UPI0018691496|nr:hypothetical protein [Nostoc sp. MG11]
MLKFVERILVWLRGETLKLVLLAGVLLLVWGTLSPVGTLVWWLSQSAETLGLSKNQNRKLLSVANSKPYSVGHRSTGVVKSTKIYCYIIYLLGVGDFSANQLTSGEEFFLQRLVELHPNCVVVDDVFPYSVQSKSLAGQGLLAPLWRAAKNADGWLSHADILIKIRNLWRFAISADERYGSIYNQGIADASVDRMNAAHSIPQSHKQPLKLILIGTSGGVQVALGAASYLDKWLNAQLVVVSVGGSFDGNTGFEAVDQMYHLQGRRDWVEDISRFLFASRWSLTVGSPFNQARRQGRYTVQVSGDHTHDGAEGYFGQAFVGTSKTTYVQLTLQKVNQLPIWSD